MEAASSLFQSILICLVLSLTMSTVPTANGVTTRALTATVPVGPDSPRAADVRWIGIGL